MENPSDIISDLYKGSHVLVTGFTGFIGKLIVEKLLWSCRDVEKIYVLVRKKRGVSAQERVNQVLSGNAFLRVRQEVSDHLTKVVAVEGDVTEEGLGLSERDTLTLTSLTTVVIHGAATVRFNESLADATTINTLGTYQLVQLAKNMANLKCFSHISTAYSNCHRQSISEQVYPPLIDWRDLIKITQRIDRATSAVLSQKFCRPLPNTYTFTKNAAEHIIDDARKYFPVVICRPSIVVSSKEEPVGGWIDTVIGGAGLIVGTAMGIIRAIYSNPDVPMDLIYADYVVKGVLASFLFATYKRDQETRVINLSASESHCVSETVIFNDIVNSSNDFMMKVNGPCCHTTHYFSELNYMLNLYQKHFISAYLIDFLLQLAGQRPLLVKLRRKIYLTSNELLYFKNNVFYIDNTKFQELSKAVSTNRNFYLDLFSKTDHAKETKKFFEVGFKEIVGNFFLAIPTYRQYMRILKYVDLGIFYLFYALYLLLLYRLEIFPRILSCLYHFFTDDI